MAETWIYFRDGLGGGGRFMFFFVGGEGVSETTPAMGAEGGFFGSVLFNKKLSGSSLVCNIYCAVDVSGDVILLGTSGGGFIKTIIRRERRRRRLSFVV